MVLEIIEEGVSGILGIFWNIFLIFFCFILFLFLLLFLYDVYLFFKARTRIFLGKKKKREREREEGEKKGEEISPPPFIPYEDYLWHLGKFFYLMVADPLKLRDPIPLMKENMASEAKHHVMCRQAVVGTFPGIHTWDADHFKDVFANEEKFHKFSSSSRHFKNISEKSVLFVEGEEWQDQHRLIFPAFQMSHLNAQIPKFNFVAHRMIDQLNKEVVSSSSPFEAFEWMSKATLDGLGIAGFGLDMKSLLGQTTREYSLYSNAMKGLLDPLKLVPYFEDLPTKSNLEWRRNIKEYMEFLGEVVREKKIKIKEKREREGERGGEEGEGERKGMDILDILLEARGEGEEEGEGNSRGLGDRELAHNLNIFFIAGHETSSSTLSFCLHLLQMHPEYQTKLREEIKEVVGERDPTQQDLKDLKLLLCFVKEAMRVFPPAPALLRIAKMDTQVGEWQIRKGDYVLYTIYTTHHHPKYWVDPDRFWPERFLPENSKGRNPFAYTPFSAGPRICIGNNFALIEMRIFLIHILKNFEVMENLKTSTPFGLYGGLTLRPPPGCTLLLKPLKE